MSRLESRQIIENEYLGKLPVRNHNNAVYLLGAAPHFRHRKNLGCEVARSPANAVPGIKGRFSTLWPLNDYLERGATPRPGAAGLQVRNR